MKIVNVSVRGGNTAEGSMGVSFSVLPSEVLVQVPGGQEPVLSVPIVDNPLISRQSYSFVVDGYEVDLDVNEIVEGMYDECGDDGEGLTEEELNALMESDAQAALDEVLGEPELEETLEPEEEVGPDNGRDTGYFEELENAALDAVLGEPELAENMEPEEEVGPDNGLDTGYLEEIGNGAVEPRDQETITEIPDIIEITSSRQEAPVEEEAETAFFQRDERGSEPVVDADETLVPVGEEQEHNVEDLKVLLAQTQDLLKKYDLNSVEH